jgi:hypothetical protein
MIGDYKHVWCHNEHRTADQDLGDGRCVVQGVLLLYFAWANLLWWFLLCANMFLTIVLEIAKERFQSTRLHVAFHCIGWGIPAILIIPPLAYHKFRYNDFDNFCFVDTWNIKWIYGFFFVPLICFNSVGLLMLVVRRRRFPSEVTRR